MSSVPHYMAVRVSGLDGLPIKSTKATHGVIRVSTRRSAAMTGAPMGAVPPQNPVDRTIVEVSSFGIKLTYPVPPQNLVHGTIVDVSALGIKLAIALRTTSWGATHPLQHIP